MSTNNGHGQSSAMEKLSVTEGSVIGTTIILGWLIKGTGNPANMHYMLGLTGYHSLWLKVPPTA